MTIRSHASLILVSVLAIACGCSSPEIKASEETSTTGTEAQKEVPKPTVAETATDQFAPLANPKDGEEVAVLDTGAGKIVLRFFEDVAPNHVKNFKELAKNGFYDGTKFHRTMPGFMIQGGDPNTKSGDASTWGEGGPGKTVDAEFNPVPHKRGILSMARSQDPNSAGSQFFIVVKDSNFLDGQYTAFGAVVSGMEAADKIVQTPTTDDNGTVVPEKAVKLKSVEIVKWPVKP